MTDERESRDLRILLLVDWAFNIPKQSKNFDDRV